MSTATRVRWIDAKDELAVARQCALAQVARSSFYGRHPLCGPSAEDLLLMRPIDEEYTRRPFYGSRRMVVFLGRQGHVVNRKHVQRLMRRMALAGMAPGPMTSKPHPEHRVYPYLWRGVAVTRRDQAWSTDITYILLAHGFVYLVAVIDWYSRRVLAWRISNSMGRTRPRLGQHFRRAALAQRQTRRRVPERLRHGCRADGRSDRVLRLLQQRAAAPSLGLPYPR